jgi:hypothetical protein
MGTSEVIALVSVVIAVVAIGFPIWQDSKNQERRFRASVDYRLQGFWETSKYCRELLKLQKPIDREMRRTLRNRGRGLLEALTDDADLVEKRLSSVEQEDGRREARRYFHLMTTELDWRLQKSLSNNDILFAYSTGAIAALLLSRKPYEKDSVAQDAVAMLGFSERAYKGYTSQTGQADTNGRTLPPIFFREAIRNVLSSKMQDRIAQRG